jgi:predicted DNA-binding transcriptional regulator YafY
MYDPTGRVLTVLELLQSRPGLTGPELASRLEMDVRTVRRYIAKLQDAGIPVEACPGRYGGYRLRSGYKLPPLVFSDAEATAIVLGLLGNAWLEIDQSPAAVEGALSKITRVLPQAARDRLASMSSVTFISPCCDDARPAASLLILLGDAIQGRERVRIGYTAEGGELTDRVVEPYGLVGRQGKWYLVAFCRLRGGYRTFRLDRIGTVEPTAERFARDEEFDFRAYAIKQLTSYAANWRISVVFTSPLPQVRARLPASLGRIEETADGVGLEWEVDDLDYAARYLMSLGLRFAVREPPELRAAFAALAAEAAGIARGA